MPIVDRSRRESDDKVERDEDGLRFYIEQTPLTTGFSLNFTNSYELRFFNLRGTKRFYTLLKPSTLKRHRFYENGKVCVRLLYKHHTFSLKPV